jgi:hypothetical protein
MNSTTSINSNGNSSHQLYHSHYSISNTSIQQQQPQITYRSTSASTINEYTRRRQQQNSNGSSINGNKVHQHSSTLHPSYQQHTRSIHHEHDSSDIDHHEIHSAGNIGSGGEHGRHKSCDNTPQQQQIQPYTGTAIEVDRDREIVRSKSRIRRRSVSGDATMIHNNVLNVHRDDDEIDAEFIHEFRVKRSASPAEVTITSLHIDSKSTSRNPSPTVVKDEYSDNDRNITTNIHLNGKRVSYESPQQSSSRILSNQIHSNIIVQRPIPYAKALTVISAPTQQRQQQPASSQSTPVTCGGYCYDSITHTGLSPYRTAIVSVVSCVLQQLFGNGVNDQLPEDPSLITVFHTAVSPSISISQYAERIAKYTDCSNEVLVMSLIHINRILHTRPSIAINSLNIHRIFLTSVMCAAKFFDDQYFNNAYYAKVGGVATKELNWLEVEFLALINFDLLVAQDVYQQFYTELMLTALHQSCTCKHKQMPPLPKQKDLSTVNINHHEWKLYVAEQQQQQHGEKQNICIKATKEQLDRITDIKPQMPITVRN